MYRGEPIAGLVLSTSDLRAAQRALGPWIREFADHDARVVSCNVANSDRGRRDRVRMTLALLFMGVAVTRIAWLAVSWF